ncbi:TPR repeat protein [Stagonosporopsis vannaccii]|nr:TPR repeat protein [Stagonosporopsis vannaccii]
MAQQTGVMAAPDMPPAMAEIKKQSVDEVLAEMNRMPLFMTTLDETDGEGGENVLLEAMKALAYEGTRYEVAENFRQQGNECARAKQWNDAKEFYDKAIAALKGPQRKPDPEADAEGGKVIEVELDEKEEAEKEKVVEEASYVNRALCNLEKSKLPASELSFRSPSVSIGKSMDLRPCRSTRTTPEEASTQHPSSLAMQNYRSCINDCASTLRLNPSNIKAYYRSGSACLALDKLAEAKDACEFGLKLDPSNAPLKTLAEKIQKRSDYIAKVEADRRAREEKAASERATLDLALKARNVTVRTTTDEAPDLEDAKIQLENPLDPSSPLSYPCLLLYPADSQSDFVKAFNEHQTLPEHLEYIFPLPWDEENEYTIENVEAYMETAAGGLIKVGKKMALHKVLGSGKVVVSDGLVRISVVPKAKSAAWIEEFKKRRGATA